MSAADDRAIAMLKRYLAEGCRPDDDYLNVMAHQFGAALAMLGNLLDLYEFSHPRTTRELFELWRANQPVESAPEPKP